MEIHRVLTLTHLRREERRNLDSCTRLWQLRDPVFADGSPFSRKLSLVEEGGRLPDSDKPHYKEARIYSFTGALDDPEPTHQMKLYHQKNFTAVDFGFTSPGHNTYVLGGGNLDYCLFRTLTSLVNIKQAQGDKLDALIPLAMVYHQEHISNPIQYALGNNHYSRLLEKLAPQNHRISADGEILREKKGAGPQINLHWFISLKAMFTSPFFPEIQDSATLTRIMEKFDLRR